MINLEQQISLSFSWTRFLQLPQFDCSSLLDVPYHPFSRLSLCHLPWGIFCNLLKVYSSFPTFIRLCPNFNLTIVWNSWQWDPHLNCAISCPCAIHVAAASTGSSYKGHKQIPFNQRHRCISTIDSIALFLATSKQQELPALKEGRGDRKQNADV